MSRQTVVRSSAVDRQGYKLLVDVYSGPYSGNVVDDQHLGLTFATEVQLNIGPQYGYAYVGVPVDTFGYEHAPAVALQNNGPAGEVKLRSRAKVSMVDYNGKGIPIMCGYLVQLAHCIDEDSVIGMIMDDRWLMSKVTCFGRATYDPANKVNYHDSAMPMIFNRDGYPDCIDSPFGPRFAPGKLYGYKRTNVVEDSNEPRPGQAKEVARSWRCEDIMAYLRSVYYSGTKTSRQDYGSQQVSLFVQWPKSVGSLHGMTRVTRNFKLENIALDEAVARTARKAGPYEMLMEPVGWAGRLGFVQVNSRRGGTYLTGPTYGSDSQGGNIKDALEDSTRVAGGTVTESIVGYFDDVCIAGDPPALEHMFQNRKSEDLEGDPVEDDIVELENAWSEAEEENFKKVIEDNGEDEKAFLMACRAEPRVYACYRVKKGYEANKQTLFGSWKPPCSPRILPRLLSGYAQGNDNPRDWNPREIVIEYYDEQSDPKTWRPCARYDNLEIIDDGQTFMVSSLRESGDRVTFKSDGYYPGSFEAAGMRLTCAVEREFRIVAHDRTDPNWTSARVNVKGLERFTYLAVAEDGDYSHWERYVSFPNGTAVEEPELSENFPDKCRGSNKEGSYLFSDLLQGGSDSRIKRHAKHRVEDVKRIDYNGILTMHTWNPGLKPGMQVILDVGGDSIQPKAILKSVKFNSMTQAQELELMAGDNSVIYDVPLPPPAQTAGGQPKPRSTTTPKTAPAMQTDNYETDQQSYDQKEKASHESSKPASKPTPAVQERRESPTQSSEKDILDTVARQSENRVNKSVQPRRNSGIRTGDDMSKVDMDEYKVRGEKADPNKFSAENNRARQAEAQRKAADQRQLQREALRQSVVQRRLAETEDEEE